LVIENGRIPRDILNLDYMSTKLSNPPAGFDELTIEEKLNYVASLWDRIAAIPDTVPAPDWHLEVIEQRTHEREAGAPNGRSWKDFREELRAKLRQRRSTP
jgi:Putative addiction module component